MAKVHPLVAVARSVLRTVGPRMSAADALQDQFTFRRCSSCTPDPERFSCPVCGYDTTQRWQLKLHFDLNPLWCQNRGKRKIRAWAAQS